MPSSSVTQHLQVVLFLVVVVLFAIAAAAAATTTSPNSSSSTIAKEGCRDRCGNVNVPYPFGIGNSNCYYDKAFEITCNDSYNPPLPFLQGSFGGYFEGYFESYQVLQLTPDYVRVNVLPNPAHCYNNESKYSGVYETMPPYLFNTSFTISSTRNKLTAVGCGIFAYIQPPSTGNYTSSGCASFCVDEKLGNLTSCFGGNGCCQTSITEDLQYLDVRMAYIQTSNRSSITGQYCGHVFVVEDGFTGLNKLNLSREDTYVPVFLDWTIGGKYSTTTCTAQGSCTVKYNSTTTCKEAQRNSTTYGCGKNTDCVDSKKGLGYNCKCLKGYTGNPYLPHGCQDIDECKEAGKCGKDVICINTEGSYQCACPADRKFGFDDRGGLYCMPHKQRIHVVVIVSSGIGLAIVLILLLATGFWMYRRLEKRKQMILKQKHFKRNGGLLLKQKISSNDGRVEKAAQIFVTEELERATDNFNQSRIIGKGGFGTVYKGMLSDGRIVAIKKSKLVDESQVDQFINEMVILSQINQRHIVKLLGCCLETQVPLLVYEFISNGTLSYHLHDEGGHQSSISWKERLRIATEVAGALAYLHSDASIPIFHRDIKSSNILLDENYKSKVSDFGISRSVPLDKTHLTTLVQGTFGYLDPEYFHSSQFTEKSDVYSFGVVLVELLTGEKAISQIRNEEEKSLALYFISSMKENRLFEILPARVVNEGDKDDVLVVAKLAKRCLKLNGKKRPTMKEVSIRLDGLRKFLQKTQEEEEECLIGDEILSDYTSGTFKYDRSESYSSIVMRTA